MLLVGLLPHGVLGSATLGVLGGALARDHGVAIGAGERAGARFLLLFGQRLQHDAAAAIATACLHAISPCLHQSLHKQAWEWLYEIAKREIVAYGIQVDRMRQRLLPMDH